MPSKSDDGFDIDYEEPLDSQDVHDMETVLLNQDGEPEAVPEKKQRHKDRRFIYKGSVGKGGICLVGKVYDSLLNRYNANKFLRHEYQNDTSAIKRFKYEAQITAQLEHPNIIPVHDYYYHENMFSINMRLVDGLNFDQHLRNQGEDRLYHLNANLNILQKVLDAVGFAHSKGVAHRDLKPANVMIGKFGEVYVMDWGIVRKFKSTDLDENNTVLIPEEQEMFYDKERGVIGTPAFMSPEQANGHLDEIDGRSDIFSLGGILFYIMTGYPPYYGENTLALAKARKVRKPQTDMEYVPVELLNIAKKAMQKEKKNRYQTAYEMQQDISHYLNGRSLKPIKYQAGEQIFNAGDVGLSAYFIQHGKCLAYLDQNGVRKDIREMMPGEVFGELSVISKQSRSLSVKAVTDVTLLEITSDTLKSGLGGNQWLGTLVSNLVTRFLDIEGQLKQSEDTSTS